MQNNIKLREKKSYKDQKQFLDQLKPSRDKAFALQFIMRLMQGKQAEDVLIIIKFVSFKRSD